jgi:hypothetical protein
MLIDANRSGDEGWRIDRLKKARYCFCAIYGISEQQASLLIDAIYDHKGFLSVMWKRQQQPTPEQIRAWGLAWELCKEPKENVTHNDPDLMWLVPDSDPI